MTKKYVAMKITGEMHQGIKVQAAKENKTMSELIEELIKEYLERKK